MGIMRRLAIPSIFFCALPIQAQQRGSLSHSDDESASDRNWSELNSSMETMLFTK